MFQVTLSKNIQNKHKAYFDEFVVPKLIESQESIQFQKYNRRKTKKEYKKFIDFILSEEKENHSFSIGKPNELIELKNMIESNFPIIISLLDKKVVRKGASGQMMLKDYIFDLFGYNEFTTVTFFDYLKEKACEELNVKRYNDTVQSKMVNMLCNTFPKDKEWIEKNIPKTGLCIDQFKENLKKLCEIGIGITMYNFNQSTDSLWNAYSFVFESGLRVCPYCNRQYITPVLTSNGMMRADLDHVLSKKRYPYLSMSLYNLVPSCQQCNQSLKGDKESVINPYGENLNSYFNFRIDETGNIRTKNLNVNPKTQDYLDMFKIELLYNYHKNQGVNLVKKRIAYPESYITELYQKNKNYFKDETTFRELIFGYFTSEEKINEEAFSKFRRDIASQLGIIGNTESTKLIENLKKYLTELDSKS